MRNTEFGMRNDGAKDSRNLDFETRNASEQDSEGKMGNTGCRSGLPGPVHTSRQTMNPVLEAAVREIPVPPATAVIPHSAFTISHWKEEAEFP